MAHVPRRFWITAIAGGVTSLLLVLTLLWHDWIELLLGADPDGGSGAIEWMVVVLTAGVAVTCLVIARLEWRAVRAARVHG